MICIDNRQFRRNFVSNIENYKSRNMLFFKTVMAFLRDDDYKEILVTSSIVIAIGTIFYHYQEGWRWIDSLYFSVITLTTIGYGDFSPQTDLGKIFTLFYIIIGLGMILSFFHILYNHFNDLRLTGRRKIGEGEEDPLDKQRSLK